jgi:hypothetical protein
MSLTGVAIFYDYRRVFTARLWAIANHEWQANGNHAPAGSPAATHRISFVNDGEGAAARCSRRQCA